jgi:hypothetical protein
VPVTVSQTSDVWGGVAKAALKYNGEKTTYSLGFSYDLAPASGLNGAAQRTAFLFDIRQRFTYEFSGALATGYFLNYAGAGQYGTNAIDEATFFLIPSLRYDFNKDLYLDLGYDFTTTKYNLTNTSANRNLVFVRLFVQYPLFE